MINIEKCRRREKF